ncbi:MAG: hypothetical protein ABIO80_00350 [Sphingomicrobium sp.]
MRSPLILVAVLLGSCVAPPPGPVGPFQAQELLGRVAGPAQRCVYIQRDMALRPANGDPSTLLYGFGKTIYANHLSAGCGFRQDQTLIMHPIGSEYCVNDVARSVEIGGFPGPSCNLNMWVPYTAIAAR